VAAVAAVGGRHGDFAGVRGLGACWTDGEVGRRLGSLMNQFFKKP
jgi:hypothetical protein